MKKTLKFNEEFLPKILFGTKTVTRRVAREDNPKYVPGEIVRVANKDNVETKIKIKIVSVRKEKLLDMKVEDIVKESKKEGYHSFEEWQQSWDCIYTDENEKFYSNPVVYVYEFKLVKLGIGLLICVYKHPRDYPNKYVARIWNVINPTNIVYVADDLEELRKIKPISMVIIPRQILDDPVIVETWV